MNKDKNIPVGFSLEQGDLNRPSTGRPVIYANNGIISSGQRASLIKEDGSVKRGRIKKLLGFG